jgi:hypothetical protein
MSQFKSIASATFGAYGRYQLEVAISRFNKPVFFVKDAAVLDNGLSAIVRQSDDIREALEGITDEVNQPSAPFKGLRPNTGDTLVNLGHTLCKFKNSHHSGGWLVEIVGTKETTVVNPEFTHIIRNDGRSCPDWD